jgi:hypothetical protein
MLLLYVLCIIAVVARDPTYTRSYLRDQKRVADEKRMIEERAAAEEMMVSAVKYIETSIFAAASRGETKYSPPFYGCQEAPGLGISSKTCELMVPRIRAIIARRFPDSEITYDAMSHQFMMRW